MKYPLKPMSLGEILDTAFKVFTQNFLLLAGIGILMQVLTFAVVFGLTFVLISTNAPVWAAALLMIIPLILIMPISTAVSTKVIADRYLAVPTSLGAAFRFAFRILFPLLGATLVAGLLTGIGFLLLIIPGIFLLLRFILVGPATVVEGHGYLTALRRSGELVSGQYGKMFGLVLILWVASSIVNYSIESTLGAESWTAVIVSNLLVAVIGAYASTVWVITYFERRCDKEGFDLQLLAASIGEEVDFSDAEDDFDQDDDWAPQQ